MLREYLEPTKVHEMHAKPCDNPLNTNIMMSVHNFEEGKYSINYSKRPSIVSEPCERMTTQHIKVSNNKGNTRELTGNTIKELA